MRSIVALLCVVTMAALAGCDSSQVDGPEGASSLPPIPSWPEYLAGATPLAEGGFRVEGDLFFASEQSLHEHYDEAIADDLVPKAHVFAQGNLPTASKPLVFPRNVARDIRYCVAKADFDAVDSRNYALAVADVAAATLDWERQANVNFRHVVSLDTSAQCTAGSPEPVAPVDFVVGPFNTAGFRGCADPSWLAWDDSQGTREAPCYYGTARSPADGPMTRLAFDILVLDYGAIRAQAATGITGVAVARHELGHKLGFSHEHAWTPGGNPCTTEGKATWNGAREAIAINPWLPAYDSVSVMHYPGEYCSPVNPNYGPDIGYRLSVMDGYSARALYGMPVSWHLLTANLL